MFSRKIEIPITKYLSQLTTTIMISLSKTDIIQCFFVLHIVKEEQGEKYLIWD